MSNRSPKPTYETVPLSEITEGQTFWPGRPPTGAIIAAAIVAEPDMATLVTDDVGVVYAFDSDRLVQRAAPE